MLYMFTVLLKVPWQHRSSPAVTNQQHVKARLTILTLIRKQVVQAGEYETVWVSCYVTTTRRIYFRIGVNTKVWNIICHDRSAKGHIAVTESSPEWNNLTGCVLIIIRDETEVNKFRERLSKAGSRYNLQWKGGRGTQKWVIRSGN